MKTENAIRRVSIAISLIALLVGIVCPYAAAQEEVAFDIASFEVKGNTIFPGKVIDSVLDPFAGSGKTVDDVEKARDALETYYHSQGYPTVLVNIPEQNVDEGVVQLEVIESRIRRIRVTGNRYFTMEKVLKDLPSIRPGGILYIPDIQEELMNANRNPDLKVAPVLIPGKELGSIDIELKVKDKIPVHGSLELNNRYSANTTSLRLNGTLSYDNLWQKDHSVSVQYQTSPEKMEEVQSLSASYILPSPLGRDQMSVVYALWSDSETAFGDGFQVIGKGFVLGFRQIIPLPETENYYHNASIGIDYKDFKEGIGFSEAEDALETPLRYTPVAVSYAGSLKGETGTTRVSFGLNLLFRGIASDLDEFEDKRFRSRGNHLYVNAGLERHQELPGGLKLLMKGDGQLASQPLVSNEQYIAGGMNSVRGYKESEAAGDHALHGTIELSRPDLFRVGKNGNAFSLYPFLFVDAAKLYIRDPLPGQADRISIQGAGGGIRGKWGRFLEFEVDAALALADSDATASGDSRLDFRIRARF